MSSRRSATSLIVTLNTLPEGVGQTDLRSRALQRPRKPLRILLAEDHGDTQRTLSRLLTHFGHEVLTADNKQRALELLGSGNIDVLLRDIGLPEGSGYGVVAHAKRKPGYWAKRLQSPPA